ncbi:MAG TPA: hypothetical protein PKG75_03745, partial [Clostridiales bacterium]|nr:hypothetical protein [Clostridiales bacterium]
MLKARCQYESGSGIHGLHSGCTTAGRSQLRDYRQSVCTTAGRSRLRDYRQSGCMTAGRSQLR